MLALPTKANLISTPLIKALVCQPQYVVVNPVVS